MAHLLVTFAVREEGIPFQKLIGERPELRVRLTGIGPRNAERSIRQALIEQTPACVFTCGFAGGLNPALTAGHVLFAADEESGRSATLLAAGAHPAVFHCVDRICTTAREKRALRERTAADAVEMESGIIRRICREHGIPGATVRVISDAADEDLPLDFNALMDAEQNLHHGRLAAALLRSPASIGALLRLRKQTRAAARKLAEVLVRVISDPAPAAR